MMKVFFLALSAITLFSCSPQSASYTSNGTYGRMTAERDGYVHHEGIVDKDVKTVTRDRKLMVSKMIVYNAFIRVVTKNVDTLHKDLKTIAEKHEGYVLTLGDNEAVIRVKASNINQALVDIGKKVKLKSKTVRGEDVTEEFTNLQVRLDNANKSRQRYLELLQKATTVEETLKVEKELERLNLEIDLLEGKLNKISHLVEYSTIRIDIDKKKVLGPLGYVSVGVWKLIKVLFVIKG